MADQLLYNLSKILKCIYISDIPKKEKADIIGAINSLEFSKYLPVEWSDAISYIVGEKIQITSVEQAVEYIARAK